MIDTKTLIAIRFGTGLPLPEGAPLDPEAMLQRLAGPDLATRTWPGLTTAAALSVHAAAAAATKRRKQQVVGPDGDMVDGKDAYRATRQALRLQSERAVLISVARAVGATDGFRERLVRFWADHFTTVAKSPLHAGLVPAMVDDVIRANVTGRFSDLLIAATLHPAMILYLDQHRSVGPNSPKSKGGRNGLNENLARELIELHSLGVDATYAQSDVRQMAELLTGLLFAPGQGQVFNAKAAEPGPETVLGQTYDGDGVAPILAALEDLALRPETARHLSRKLAVHFVSDTPDPAMIAAMTDAYAETGGDLMAVYRAMLLHPSAWLPDLAKARQPYDFIIAALRALNIGPAQIGDMPLHTMAKRLLQPMARMGQPMYRAPGPDGWAEEAEAWITPQGLAARITWAMEVPSRLLAELPEPDALGARALGPLISAPLAFAMAAAENRREGVGLVLASAEFNRR